MASQMSGSDAIRFSGLILLLGALSAGLAYSPLTSAQLRTGQVAQLGAQRVLINVTNGGVSTDGYYIFIEGIPGPFFSAGGPSQFSFPLGSQPAAFSAVAIGAAEED